MNKMAMKKILHSLANLLAWAKKFFRAQKTNFFLNLKKHRIKYTVYCVLAIALIVLFHRADINDHNRNMEEARNKLFKVGIPEDTIAKMEPDYIQYISESITDSETYLFYQDKEKLTESGNEAYSVLATSMSINNIEMVKLYPSVTWENSATFWNNEDNFTVSSSLKKGWRFNFRDFTPSALTYDKSGKIIETEYPALKQYADHSSLECHSKTLIPNKKLFYRLNFIFFVQEDEEYTAFHKAMEKSVTLHFFHNDNAEIFKKIAIEGREENRE